MRNAAERTVTTASRLRRWGVAALAGLALLLHGFAPLGPALRAAALPLGPDGSVLVLCSSGGGDEPGAPAPAGHHDAVAPCALCSHWGHAVLAAPGGSAVPLPRLANALGPVAAPAAAPAPESRRAPFAARGPPIA